MATSVARRRFGTTRSTPVTPPRVAALTPARTASKSASTPAFVSAAHKQLLEARDNEALGKLSDGHTEWFIGYAQQRLDAATDPEERKLWQHYLDNAQERATEDSLGAGLKSGEVSLEDALGYLRDKRSQYEPHDPKFSDLTNQIGAVLQGIAARDFNATLAQARAQLIESRNSTTAKRTYLDTLVGLMGKAKDPKAQDALMTQVKQLQTEIQKDQLLAQSQQDTKMRLDYLTKKIGPSEFLQYLAEAAQRATDPAEARQYGTLAQQVIDRERVLQNEKIKAAATGSGGGSRGGGGSGGSGSGAASTTLAAALADVKADYARAENGFERTIKGGTPDPLAFGVYQSATQRYLDAIEQALPTANAKNAETLLKERDRVQNEVLTRQRQAGEKVIAQVNSASAGFTKTLQTLRDGKAPVEDIARATTLRAAAIDQAAKAPFMLGDQRDKLAAESDTVREHLRDIVAKAQAAIRDDATPAGKKLAKDYQSYADAKQAKGQEALPFDQWLNALRTDPGSVLANKADFATFGTLVKQRDDELAQQRDAIMAATAPRDPSGARIAPDANGLIPNRISRAQDFGYSDTGTGLFNQPDYGGTPTDQAQTQDLQNGADAMPGGVTPPDPGAIAADRAGGAAEGYGLTGSQATVAAPQSPDAQDRSALSLHDAAMAYLQEPVPLDVPTWNIEPLPSEPAFMSVPVNEWRDYTPPSPLSLAPPPSYAAPDWSAAPVEGMPEAYTPADAPPDAGGYAGDTTGQDHGR